MISLRCFSGRVACGFAMSLLLAGAASAQYGLKSGVYNRLSQRVPANNTAKIPPVGPNATPTGDPVITPQFSNVVETNASAGPLSGGYPGSVSGTSGVYLRNASFGTSFASGVPRYSFGDQLLPPSSIVNGSGVTRVITDPATYWRAEPVRAGETLTNPTSAPAVDYKTGASATIPALPSGVLPAYYYSPHAMRTFANTPGLVEVTWRSSVPDPQNNGNYVFYKESFTVSSATARPVRTMFWTEKSFSAPRITIPTGKVVTVNPVYSNVFPETVPQEFVVVGSSQADPNASATEILRTLWYEKTNGIGELHAYNITGRILVEYLGTRRPDGTHEFLGADIVSVEQSVQSKTLTVELGNELRPEPDEDLQAQPVTSDGTATAATFYGSNPRSDGSLAYFAERENDVEDRVAFYWLEKNDAAIANPSGVYPGLAIQWPKYLNKYLQVWPGDVSDFVASTVGSGGSTVENGTGLKFDGGKIPAIVYQDSPAGDETIIDSISQRLVVGLGQSTDKLNRTLLKFTGENGGIWYVRLMTQADGRSGFQEGDGGPALNTVAYVGDRLAPPSSAYSTAGYVASGTSYSPRAYIDPFQAGVAAAEKGAIIPVNALPGTSNPLTVWWFKKVEPPSSEFTGFYTAAKVGRYTVAYRSGQDAASENFEGGATGWSSAVTATGPTGLFLGPYGSGAMPSTQKTFDLSGYGGSPSTVAFTFLRIDSWDYEYFKVSVNGNLLINQMFVLGQEVTQTVSGSSAFPEAVYDWTISPVAGRYAQFYGNTGWLDQAFRVTIKVTPVTPISLNALTIGFGSNLNSAATDEAFGIDDFSIVSPQPQIILASNQGTGPLAAPLSGSAVYNQPDPARPGYNPNEEHALILGGRAYALRDDLNLTTGTTPSSVGVSFSSLPRVLLEYTDPDDQRPAMAVYEVLRETTTYPFSYGVTAGTILGSPMPLPLMPLPVANDGTVRNSEVVPGTGYSDPPANTSAPTSYTPFTFKDRKGYDWVYRGPHNGGTKSLGMQFYYTMRADFAFPGLAVPPAVGTPLPYLRAKNASGAYVGDPVTATPLTILYYPVWPSQPPTLAVGETLALPKRGLPSVRGQTSARVLYQQSIARTASGPPSVVLQDPTRAKSVLINDTRVGMNALPVSLKTTTQDGKTYFQLAQPHLQQRFYFDPLLGDKGGLVLVGEFRDEVAGEDYLHLNTLSASDVTALETLVDDADPDKSRWSAAIVHLTTAVETFMENPASRGTYIADSAKTVQVGYQTLPEIVASDTAVDSYALTALGKGSGYVTLLFGDGEAFTPQGEPVAMQIIKVEPKLYQGDLRTIPASNPLDEQTTVRHSGDFAARPGDYTFEWRYALPVGGKAPPIYRTDLTTVVGNAAATPSTANWFQLTNPTAVPPSNLPYPSNAVSLPRSIQINNASHAASSGLPGQILKSAAGLTLSEAVPTQVFLSTTLSTTAAGAGEGFVLFVNGVPALTYQVPAGVPVPGNLTPVTARSGLVPGGLPNQFEIDPSFFSVGANQIEIALYSAAAPGAGASTSVDFRIDLPVRTDLVVSSSEWQSPGAPPPGSPPLSNMITIGGSAASPLGDPLLVFSDSYFTMRYRAKDPNGMVTGAAYSEWMQPVLVESWVKRVLDGINPFNQRQTDLYNNPVSTDVSILTQAGKRWEGDVALNLSNINDFGLIEIYETVLNRVKKQSLDADVTTDSVNSTLLLAAGYLNDLYMTLGNEAADDAANPTILLDGSLGPVDAQTSRFSFEGQVATMMDETLALLRGRDDFLSPGTRTNPSYNRLYWNYTNGINSGEPFYAINYDIKEKSGSATANGVLDAADAQILFPQGHGDAYGHYLTALTGYYKLLTSSTFTWVPSSEAVTVLGQTVQVDYQDERKFAAAAASLARTGVDIIDYTARTSHEDTDEAGWAAKKDGKYNPNTGRTRHWGTDEWASRVFQGAYYNWVAGNAMLPEKDTVNEGIEKVDRTTVPELNELVASAAEVLNLSFGEQAHLNPLGLAADSMSFDVSPAEMAEGRSHFEQLYDRAVKAAINARNAYRQAGSMNHQLRQQNGTIDSYNEAVTKQEDAYENELISLYGTPYSGDIGPGKLYAQGYAGPDLYHSYFIDRPSALVDVGSDVTVIFNEPLNHDPFTEWSVDTVYERLRDPVQFVERSFRMSPYTLGQFSDTVASGLGRRGQVGAIQGALLDVYEAQVNLREAADAFTNLNRRFDRDYQLYSEFLNDYEAANDAAAVKLDEAAAMTKASFALVASAAAEALLADYIVGVAEAAAEAAPTAAGLAVDGTSVLRSAIRMAGVSDEYALRLLALISETSAGLLDAQAADLEGQAQSYIDDYNFDQVAKQHVVEFERLYDQVLESAFEITRRLSDLQRANERVSRLYADASRILSERETFRQRAASVVQGYRTRDLVFRELRNEELSQYKGLFDLAQTYSYLAAKAYDYETGLLGAPRGREFINGIIGSYSVGAWSGSEPIATNSGDSGLASMLSGLRDDWLVAKGRLGINNPDRNGTLFSLRQELFRITADQPTASDDTLWKQVLQQHIRSNVLDDPDVAIYCTNIRKPNNAVVPGLVIPFSTTIEQGLNFFGWPLAAGDHAFSPSAFATKIHSSGVVLSGYVGMDPFAEGRPGAGGPVSSAPNALAATPYVYLIPAGADFLRMPPLGDTNTIRSWSVKDQAIPLPKNLGAAAFSALQFFTPQGSINEQLWIRRKHQAFRAVDDPVYFYSSLPAEFTNSRLVGRSVWNTQWKIVIPAYSLLNDEQTGLDRFVKSVTDIKLFLRTYSHSGN